MNPRVFFLFLIIGSVFADGPKDNDPFNVRQVPKLGIELKQDDVQKLESGLVELEKKIAKLNSKPSDFIKTFISDVEIYFRAVQDNLEYKEFFSDKHVKAAYKLLETGKSRADELMQGKASWTQQTGLVVRGFKSHLDGSVQPYGLVIPENYQSDGERSVRLDIWFHGRGETMSETAFIDKQSKVIGYYSPKDTIVLHPYGRYSNAFKFAGEVDVLEALEHVKQQYRIDEDRISVRGFSMGGAGCWQFAHLYSDRWFAANPGAGFSETPEFLKSFQQEILKPYWWEEKLWRWYDSDDNALNYYHVPTIAYSGELDRQKQAADLMEQALIKEGLDLVHIIGAHTNHKIAPVSQLIIEDKMSSLAKVGNDLCPKKIKKVTHTLKYNRQYWLSITGLKEHWEPARVEAEVLNNHLKIKTNGVTALKFEMKAGLAPFDITAPISIEIDGQILEGARAKSDRSWTDEIHVKAGRWVSGKPSSKRVVKRHGLQGPIDDAFMSSFLMVTPTGKPIHSSVGDWVKAEQERAVQQWRQHFRGHARVKKDEDVSEEDVMKHNLILWGDMHSNKLIEKIMNKLPLKWTDKVVSMGKKNFDSKSHAPIMIYPNPLNPDKYIVINSGFTYREYAYLNNARQVPMLPDWAIVDIVSQPSANDARTRFAGIPKDADFFNEQWELK